MSEIEPITREELLLNSIAGEGDSGLSPITRQEMYLSAIAGESDLPEGMEPITREELYYQKILDNGGAGGGGGEATGTKTININANGTTSHNVKAYATAEIITNVPNPSTGTKQISQNGTHDVTNYASAQVNVPNSYESSDEGKVVSNGALVGQTSRQITSNGTVDTTLNDEVVVNVPTGITPTGTLNVNQNGTVDVTQYASANVNVPTGITPSGSQTYTQNGTYDVTNLAEAVVNVSGQSQVVMAEGYFTKTEDGAMPTLTHNLHTQNIAALIVPASEISATAGYRNFYVEYVNADANMLESELPWVFDWTSYNSNFSDKETATLPSNSLHQGAIHCAPWTTQQNWYSGGNPSFFGRNMVELTDDTVRFKGTISNSAFCKGTYHWYVWKLGD